MQPFQRQGLDRIYVQEEILILIGFHRACCLAHMFVLKVGSITERSQLWKLPEPRLQLQVLPLLPPGGLETPLKYGLLLGGGPAPAPAAARVPKPPRPRPRTSPPRTRELAEVAAFEKSARTTHASLPSRLLLPYCVPSSTRSELECNGVQNEHPIL
jgi:hypothetical protein